MHATGGKRGGRRCRTNVRVPPLAIAREHHRGIVDAIGRRQGTRAESLAREHACIARRILEMSLSDSATLSRVPGALLINV